MNGTATLNVGAKSMVAASGSDVIRIVWSCILFLR